MSDVTESPTLDQDHTIQTSDDHGSHTMSDGRYIVIAVILAVITAAEVSLSYIDVGAIFIPTLLVLMTIKFLMVVSYFMHLKFDNRIFSFLFYTGLVLALGVYLAALATFRFFD